MGTGLPIHYTCRKMRAAQIPLYADDQMGL